MGRAWSQSPLCEAAAARKLAWCSQVTIIIIIIIIIIAAAAADDDDDDTKLQIHVLDETEAPTVARWQH